MRIHTATTFQLTDDPLVYLPISDESFEYDGPVALADRAAQGQANKAQGAAASTGASEGSTASSLQSSLIPFYSKEMNADHAFSPDQTGELLTAAEAGAGGSTAGLEGEAEQEAARTGNTAASSGLLDEMSRNQDKASAGASEGIAAEDVAGAKQLNQEGAAGLTGLYGADTTAMLNAMGIQTGDINAEVNAGNSGWFQNVLAGINTVTGAFKGGSNSAASGIATTFAG